jgi:alpha-1,3-rhamnosyl/mannosyltransferase
MTQVQEAVLDARWLKTGIGRYIVTLLRDLKSKIPNVHLSCITMPEHVDEIAPYCDEVIPLSCSIYTFAEQFRLPAIRRRAAVFCSPHYNIPVLRRGRLLVTVHDITHLLFPAYAGRLSSKLYAQSMLRLACGRASQIVTPSEYTRQLLIEHFSVDPERIASIPCAVAPIFYPRSREQSAEAVREAYGICEPYMLYVGSAAPHKNLVGLLEAYDQLRSRRRETPALVLVLSDYGHSSNYRARIRALMSQDGIYILSAVSDHSLAELYSAAGMTVVSSYEEGFGLPAVESMACGTPVLCSNVASLPEIAGDAALYFTPSSVEDMSRAIEQLLDSPAAQHRLAVAGMERAEMYSVGRASAAYASVLSSVIERQV